MNLLHSSRWRLTQALACVILSACSQPAAKSDLTSGADAAAEANPGGDAPAGNAGPSAKTAPIQSSTGSTEAASMGTGSLSLDEATAPASVTQLQILLLSGASCLTPPPPATGITVTVSSGSTANATASTNIPAGVAPACIVANITQPFQTGQVVTLNNIPIGTYALLVFWEDAAGKAMAQGTDSSVSIAAGQTAVADIVMGTVTATTGGAGSTGSLAIHIVQPATKLAFVGAPVNAVAGSCAPLHIQMQDASGSNSPLATTIILNLTTTSTSGAFYADSACATSPLPTVQIAAGDTDATIFYKDSAAATATLKVTDPASSGLGFASTTATTTAAPAVKLAWIGPALSEPVNSCGAVQFETQNANAVPTVVPAPIPMTVSSSAATGGFFLDPACTVPVAAFNLASGADFATLYYKDSATGTATLTLTDPATGGLGTATTTAQITAH